MRKESSNSAIKNQGLNKNGGVNNYKQFMQGNSLN